MATQKSVKIESEEEIKTIMKTVQQILISTEMIIEELKDLLIPEIRQVIEGGCEIIKTREDGELAELDRQINELMAKRNQIKPRPVQLENARKREIKPLFNPKNPDDKLYTVGVVPRWLKEWLRETLGDKAR